MFYFFIAIEVNYQNFANSNNTHLLAHSSVGEKSKQAQQNSA